MRLRTLKRADYYVGGPLLAAVKPAVWLLGRILRRDHALEPRGEICFIKLLGAGSLVIAFPALLGLRRRYPALRFSLVTTARARPFAETLGVFDVISAVEDSSAAALARTGARALLRSFRADTVVDLEVYSRFTTLLSALTGARNRIGFYLESVFWRKWLHTHLIFFNRFSGVYVFYDAIAHHLGAQPASVDDCRRIFRERFGTPPLGGARRIAIGHGSSELGRERMLSAEQWCEVFERHLGRDEPAEVFLLGSRDDRPRAEGIAALVTRALPRLRFRHLAGLLPVEDSLRTLASCGEFWGVDSALLHYARLLGLRCVSFWGPTAPRTRLRPMAGLDEEIHYDKIPCSPCIHVAEEPPCQGQNLCIQGLFRPLTDKDAISWMV